MLDQIVRGAPQGDRRASQHVQADIHAQARHRRLVGATCDYLSVTAANVYDVYIGGRWRSPSGVKMLAYAQKRRTKTLSGAGIDHSTSNAFDTSGREKEL